jgi:hypothetical protein
MRLIRLLLILPTPTLKALPDLQAFQISGDAENPITVQTIITDVEGILIVIGALALTVVLLVGLKG